MRCLSATSRSNEWLKVQGFLLYLPARNKEGSYEEAFIRGPGPAAGRFPFRPGQAPGPEGAPIRAVTENAYTPLNFVDPKTGKAVGWEYDAVNEIGKRLNAKIAWNVTSWDTMIQAVRDGQFDVGMDGITITDERKKQVDFSDPYMVSQQFMLVRKDETRFTNAAEFGANPKLLIGSQAGTTNFYVAVYNVLDGKEDNPRIKLFETFGATVQALLAGDVDCVLMDAASGRGYVGANPEKLKIIGEPLGTGGLRLHLQARLRPGGPVQRGHRGHEGRRHPGQAQHQVVLRVQREIALTATRPPASEQPAPAVADRPASGCRSGSWR